jgi:cytochrome c-type biogenesis protein
LDKILTTVKKQLFIILALSGLMLSLAWIIVTPALFPGSETGQVIAAPQKSFIAPTLTLESPENTMYSLEDYRGQPVLIFFWASWCSICKRTMPELQQVYDIYQPQGFEIFAVNATTQDNLTEAFNYFKTQNYTYPMLLDSQGEVISAYQLRAFPTAVLVRPDGIIEDVVIGAGLNSAYLTAKLEQVLSGED